MNGLWRFELIKHIEFSELNGFLWEFEKSELVEREAHGRGLSGLCSSRVLQRLYQDIYLISCLANLWE